MNADLERDDAIEAEDSPEAESPAPAWSPWLSFIVGVSVGVIALSGLWRVQAELQATASAKPAPADPPGTVHWRTRFFINQAERTVTCLGTYKGDELMATVSARDGAGEIAYGPAYQPDDYWRRYWAATLDYCRVLSRLDRAEEPQPTDHVFRRGFAEAPAGKAEPQWSLNLETRYSPPDGEWHEVGVNWSDPVAGVEYHPIPFRRVGWAGPPPRGLHVFCDPTEPQP